MTQSSTLEDSRPKSKNEEGRKTNHLKTSNVTAQSICYYTLVFIMINTQTSAGVTAAINSSSLRPAVDLPFVRAEIHFNHRLFFFFIKSLSLVFLVFLCILSKRKPAVH